MSMWVRCSPSRPRGSRAIIATAHLVDLCGLTATLLIDGEGVYDPRDFNDRLLLGLKGTMRGVGVLRQRSVEALRLAARGELFTTVPIGYVRTRDDRVELDPDLRIQPPSGWSFGSCTRSGVYGRCCSGVEASRSHCPPWSTGPGRQIVWKLPVYNTIP